MVRGENILEPGTPVSFEVLTNEIKGLGLNLKLEKSSKEAPASASAT
jgi:DNA-directed RNA polymerase subunit beta